MKKSARVCGPLIADPDAGFTARKRTDAEEKSMNEILSVIVADLFDKSKGELSPKINYLRAEIKKITDSESTIVGKLGRLVESFREIIPDEKQRYHAALKALSTTSKLSREEIVAAVNKQLEELSLLEKSLIPAIPGWRGELKLMEATTQELRRESVKLRERMAWLESEEKRVLTNMAARQLEAELAEKTMWELFRELGAEITAVTKKVTEATAETATVQPVVQQAPLPRAVPVVEKVVVEQKSELSGSSDPEAAPAVKKMDEEQKKEISEPAAPQYTEFQKKCVMCGGRMDFYGNSKMWQCYSCGHEEFKADEVQGKGEEKSEQRDAPEPAPASEPPFTVPLASMSSSENQKLKKKSSLSNNHPLAQKKPCPVCHKKMQWHQAEGAWRCAFCGYERRL